MEKFGSSEEILLELLWRTRRIEVTQLVQTRLLHHILNVLTHRVATSVEIQFSTERGDTTMPLVIPANNLNEKVYIIGVDANGLKGAQLGPGQTIKLVSSDPATVDFSADTTAQPDKEGVPSMLSAAVVPKNPPAQLGVPVTVTLSINNADGSAADGTPETDTVTVTAAVAGVATSAGILFEAGVAAKGLKDAQQS